MESIEQLLISNINQKAKEIDSLTKELNKNTHVNNFVYINIIYFLILCILIICIGI
jgi:hypothetical protein